MELIIVLIIILVLFGSSRLPTISKGLGKTIGNLKKGLSGNKKTDTKTKKEVSEEGKKGGK
jgi:sec-independent protein translocase protein TatA